MKRTCVAILTFFLSLSTVDASTKLDLTTELTLASQYMTDGFRIGEAEPVWQPLVELHLRDLGVGLMFWSSLPLNRKNKEYDELDFFIRYSKEILKDQTYAIQIHGYYDFWIYPNTPLTQDQFGDWVDTGRMKGNKLHLGVSMPKLIPLASSFLIPSYNVYHWLYWFQNRADMNQGGTHHELALEYFHSIPRLLPGLQAQYLGLASTVNYHDGAFGVQPGWSHSTFRVSSPIYLWGAIFTASLNYQWSYNSSVNTQNELWTTFSATKVF